MLETVVYLYSLAAEPGEMQCPLVRPTDTQKSSRSIPPAMRPSLTPSADPPPLVQQDQLCGWRRARGALPPRLGRGVARLAAAVCTAGRRGEVGLGRSPPV